MELAARGIINLLKNLIKRMETQEVSVWRGRNCCFWYEHAERLCACSWLGVGACWGLLSSSGRLHLLGREGLGLSEPLVGMNRRSKGWISYWLCFVFQCHLDALKPYFGLLPLLNENEQCKAAKLPCLHRFLVFRARVKGQEASKISLIFSKLQCLGVCHRETAAFVFKTAALIEKQSARSFLPSARLKGMCGWRSSVVCRDLGGALSAGDAKKCKVRFLTQWCEDLALVSLSRLSPLAEHMA